MRPSAQPVAGVLLAAALAAPSFGWAQDAAGDRTVYPAGHYQAYAPRTALDMVQRTPGFVLDEGDSDLRGFGAGAGNVLIDGARPASKGGVADVLGRIPASQVERIELIRGASGGEAQGQTLILNVVRISGGVAGAWSLDVERNGAGLVYPRLEVSRSQDMAGWRTSVRLGAYWEEFPFRTLIVNRDPAGELLSSTTTNRPSQVGDVMVSGDAERALGAGVLKINGRFGRYVYDYDQPGETFMGRLPQGAPDQLQRTEFALERWSAEIGFDYTRPLGEWSWKTLGLVNYRDSAEGSADRRETVFGDILTRSVVNATARPLEIVARSTVAAGGHPLRPEFGIEAAYNRYDRTFDLALDTGSGLIPIPIPAADVVVEELRGEAFVQLAWRISSAWTLEAGLAAEGSRISVTGDANRTRTFSFLKPSLAAAWTPAPGVQVRGGVRRTVGQLSFADFAASAELDDGTTAAGNPDLGPDQTTRWFVAFDWRGAGDLAVNLEAFHEDRQDVIEQVRLPSGAPGLANAGDAAFRGIRGSATLPLDGFLRGARLTAEGEVADTAFDDPLTGRERPLSSVSSPRLSAEFRHDPPDRPLSWGVVWSAAKANDVYLVNEVDHLDTLEVFDGYLETRALGPFKTRLTIGNLGLRRTERTRRFYEPHRAGALVRVEERRVRTPTFVTLTFSGAF